MSGVKKCGTASAPQINGAAVKHTCSNCGKTFDVDRHSLLKTGWGRSIPERASFIQALDDYDKVKCPHCDFVERDSRIKVLGILPARAFVWLLLGIVLLLVVMTAAEQAGLIHIPGGR